MVETSPSLLDRLNRNPDDADWRRLILLYTPVLHGWLENHGLQACDRDDVTQEILGVVVQKMPEFRHNRRAGAFRSWLRTITIHCLRRFWRAKQYQAVAPGGSDFENHLIQLEDPASGLSAEWDRQHDQGLLRRLLGLVEPEFQPKTWQAFRLLVLEQRPAAATAAELGLTVNAVLIAKSRVLQRLRQEADGLID
ncbi:MAG TPA: sigma-70 family RNA polymerase sigma factor [Gemmataceae bacterium]|nr:sigma-70 family RNA polymerase sigma factor [Gemmataceae bacterium]